MQLEIILLKASITKLNSGGDRELPYLKPCELLKKPIGVQFTKIKKQGVKIQ